MTFYVITVKGKGPEDAVSDPQAHISEHAVPAALFFDRDDAEVAFDAIDIEDQDQFEIIPVIVAKSVSFYLSLWHHKHGVNLITGETAESVRQQIHATAQQEVDDGHVDFEGPVVDALAKWSELTCGDEFFEDFGVAMTLYPEE